MAGFLHDIDVGETSGVDYPAHLEDGWLLMKSRGDVETLLKEATATCADCGATVAKGDAFCSECGTAQTEGEGTMANMPEEVAKFLTDSKAPAEVASAITKAFAPAAPVELKNERAELLKSLPAPVRKMLTEAEDRTAKLEKQLAIETEQRETAQAIEKAASWSHVLNADEFGPVLRKLRADAEIAEAVEAVLDKAQAIASESQLFRSLGKDVGGSSSSETSLGTMATDYMAKTSTPTSYAEAYDAVLATPEGQRLYERAQLEKKEATR
jgi:hypothetical protein